MNYAFHKLNLRFVLQEEKVAQHINETERKKGFKFALCLTGENKEIEIDNHTFLPRMTCASSRALSAEDGSENQTKPNPREWLVRRSLLTAEPETVPYFPKWSFNVASVVSMEKPPTNSFDRSESIRELSPKIEACTETLKP